jgi:hypothetical protein
MGASVEYHLMVDVVFGLVGALGTVCGVAAAW